MFDPLNVILGLWVVATILMFWKLDLRTAALASVLGGWAVLPNMDYPREVLLAGEERVGPTHALALPAHAPLNKATAIGLGCLIGVLLFHGPTLRGGLPRWFDLPMIAWCLVPIASTLANGRPPAEGLAQARALVLSWGVPYVVGRLAFGGGTALLQLSRAWVIAGLAYLPLCAAEFVAGPFWYHLLYGGHTYRFSGAERPLGFRPLVLLEHGNQLGIWMVSSAVAACWLRATGQDAPIRLGRSAIPPLAVPATLVAASLAFQSHGSIVLMLLALVPLAIRGRLGAAGRNLVLGGVGLVALASIGVVLWVGIHAGGDPRQAARALFHGAGKASFTWRLARIEEQVSTIAARPLLGFGRANWSGLTVDGAFQDPVGVSLFVLSAGMYGLAGLAAVSAALLLPIGRAAWRLRTLSWDRAPWGGVSASVAVLAVSVADLGLNSVLLLPMLLAAGGLASWSAGLLTPDGLTSARPAKPIDRSELEQILGWLPPGGSAERGQRRT